MNLYPSQLPGLTAVWLFSLIASLCLCGFFLRHKLGVRGLTAFLLLILLLSVFGLLIMSGGYLRGEIAGLIGALLLIGGFWLMSRFEGFEKPSDKP